MSFQILNWSAMSILNKETLSSFFEQHSHKSILAELKKKPPKVLRGGQTPNEAFCWVSVAIKSWIQKALVDNKVLVHSVEVVWNYVDEAKCLTWHIFTKAPTHKVHKLNGGPPVVHCVQTWNLSKNLHDHIFGPKVLHTKNAYIWTIFTHNIPA